MGSITEKVKGLANEAAGNVKQVIGNAIGDTEMQADGIVQERKGELQQSASDLSSTTDKIKGLANEAAGNVKQTVGEALGDAELQADGFVQERKGEAQQMMGKAKDAAAQI